MKQDLWLREGTRAISIETEWYNPNIDTAVYQRWHADISPAGRYQPHVFSLAVRLEPYSTEMDIVRGVCEAVFLLWVLLYWGEELYELYSLGYRQYFASSWNYLELCNLTLYVAMAALWIRYMFLFDRAKFKRVSHEGGDNWPDMLPCAQAFNITAQLAAFNVWFGFLKLFKFLQMYPSTSTLWRTLCYAKADLVPFGFVLVIVMTGFTFAGNWLFGFMLDEFRSPWRSFMTLVICMGGGLPYEKMRAWSSMGAMVFTSLWFLTLAFIFLNMIVGIVCDSKNIVDEEIKTEHDRLESTIGVSSKFGVVGAYTRGILTSLGLKGISDRVLKSVGYEVDPSEGTLFDKGALDDGVAQVMKPVDIHRADLIRAKLVSGEEMHTDDPLFAELLRGDADASAAFLGKVAELARSREQKTDMREDLEQEELDEVCGDIQRIEGKIKKMRHRLRKALAEANAEASAQEGHRSSRVRRSR
jgi:hypothetical protein